MQVCAADGLCLACRETLAVGRPRLIGSAAIPVRRFGAVPPPEEDLAYDVLHDEESARTIAEHGAAAVWVAGLSAACVAGLLLYAV